MFRVGQQQKPAKIHSSFRKPHLQHYPDFLVKNNRKFDISDQFKSVCLRFVSVYFHKYRKKQRRPTAF